MKKIGVLFLSLVFFNMETQAQIHSNDTIYNTDRYQEYINVANRCIGYIEKKDLKNLEKQFVFQNQNRENFRKKADEAFEVLKKYGMPSERSLLVTTSKIIIGDKLRTNVVIEYYLPEFYSDNEKNRHSISFLFEEGDNEIKVDNLRIFEKQTDEELLKEFEEFNKKNK